VKAVARVPATEPKFLHLELRHCSSASPGLLKRIVSTVQAHRPATQALRWHSQFALFSNCVTSDTAGTPFRCHVRHYRDSTQYCYYY